MAERREIVVYGASGFTGRQVAAELARRGHKPLLAGRNAAALAEAAEALGGKLRIAVAHTDRAEELCELLAGASLLINCAGPFTDTAMPLAEAAVEARAHYIDTAAAEQEPVKRLFEQMDGPAREAGVAVVPAVGFFGTLGDMLARLASRSLAPLDDLAIAYAIQGWLPTAGSLQTAAKIGNSRYVYRDAALHPYNGERRLAEFDFSGALGRQPVVRDYPLSETVILPRYLTTQCIEALMTVSTLQEAFGAGAERALGASPNERGASHFTIVAKARKGERRRRAVATGRDIYGITAPIVAAVAAQLLADTRLSGTIGAGEAVDSRTLFESLRAQDFNFNFEVGELIDV